MGINRGITRDSALRPLARVLDVVPRLSCESLPDQIQLYDSLIKLTEQVIHRELSHLEWSHRDAIENALMAYATNRAHDLGYLSGAKKDGTPYATPEDVRRALQVPDPRFLAKLAECLKVDLPDDLAAAMDQPEAA